ncbi:MAG: hypothetical protein AAFY71_15335 [Bacteroidota bacterium]
MKSLKEKHLSSGQKVVLIEIKKHILPNYFLLSFPKTQGEPNPQETLEIFNLALQFAEELSRERIGKSHAYTLIYSGHSARRVKGWHMHIMLPGNRWRKAWLYVVLAGKNILQGLRLRKDDTRKFLKERS